MADSKTYDFDASSPRGRRPMPIICTPPSTNASAPNSANALASSSANALVSKNVASTDDDTAYVKLPVAGYWADVKVASSVAADWCAKDIAQPATPTLARSRMADYMNDEVDVQLSVAGNWFDVQVDDESALEWVARGVARFPSRHRDVPTSAAVPANAGCLYPVPVGDVPNPMCTQSIFESTPQASQDLPSVNQCAPHPVGPRPIIPPFLPRLMKRVQSVIKDASGESKQRGPENYYDVPSFTNQPISAASEVGSIEEDDIRWIGQPAHEDLRLPARKPSGVVAQRTHTDVPSSIVSNAGSASAEENTSAFPGFSRVASLTWHGPNFRENNVKQEPFAPAAAPSSMGIAHSTPCPFGYPFPTVYPPSGPNFLERAAQTFGDSWPPKLKYLPHQTGVVPTETCIPTRDGSMIPQASVAAGSPRWLPYHNPTSWNGFDYHSGFNGSIQAAAQPLFAQKHQSVPDGKPVEVNLAPFNSVPNILNSLQKPGPFLPGMYTGGNMPLEEPRSVPPTDVWPSVADRPGTPFPFPDPADEPPEDCKGCDQGCDSCCHVTELEHDAGTVANDASEKAEEAKENACSGPTHTVTECGICDKLPGPSPCFLRCLTCDIPLDVNCEACVNGDGAVNFLEARRQLGSYVSPMRRQIFARLGLSMQEAYGDQTIALRNIRERLDHKPRFLPELLRAMAHLVDDRYACRLSTDRMAPFLRVRQAHLEKRLDVTESFARWISNSAKHLCREQPVQCGNQQHAENTLRSPFKLASGSANKENERPSSPQIEPVVLGIRNDAHARCTEENQPSATDSWASAPTSPKSLTITYCAVVESGDRTVQIPIGGEYVNAPETEIVNTSMKTVWKWVVEKNFEDKITLQDVFDLAKDIHAEDRDPRSAFLRDIYRDDSQAGDESERERDNMSSETRWTRMETAESKHSPESAHPAPASYLNKLFKDATAHPITPEVKAATPESTADTVSLEKAPVPDVASQKDANLDNHGISPQQLSELSDAHDEWIAQGSFAVYNEYMAQLRSELPGRQGRAQGQQDELDSAAKLLQELPPRPSNLGVGVKSSSPPTPRVSAHAPSALSGASKDMATASANATKKDRVPWTEAPADKSPPSMETYDHAISWLGTSRTPDDFEVLRKYVDKVYDDPENETTMGRKAVDIIANYSNSQKLRNFLENCSVDFDMKDEDGRVFYVLRVTHRFRWNEKPDVAVVLNKAYISVGPSDTQNASSEPEMDHHPSSAGSSAEWCNDRTVQSPNLCPFPDPIHEPDRPPSPSPSLSTTMSSSTASVAEPAVRSDVATAPESLRASPSMISKTVSPVNPVAAAENFRGPRSIASKPANRVITVPNPASHQSPSLKSKDKAPVVRPRSKRKIPFKVTQDHFANEDCDAWSAFGD